MFRNTIKDNPKIIICGSISTDRDKLVNEAMHVMLPLQKVDDGIHVFKLETLKDILVVLNLDLIDTCVISTSIKPLALQEFFEERAIENPPALITPIGSAPKAGNPHLQMYVSGEWCEVRSLAEKDFTSKVKKGLNSHGYEVREGHNN